MINVYDAREEIDTILDVLRDRAKGGASGALIKVKNILADVAKTGDDALLRYTRQFDWPQATIECLKVTDEEIEYAKSITNTELTFTITQSSESITRYHQMQKREGFMIGEAGRRTGQIIRPLERVGVYVPGGRASYPSSVLMNIIPAKVAGVEQIVMVTPADKDGKVAPLTLVAAKEAGATEIYKVGGAQAIAALAYGTKTIKRVDKIVGPGNVYVALAKKEVFGTVGIDMVAGPSEILIIADDRANPVYIAADMISQSEHDPLSAAFLVTTSANLGERVKLELTRQTSALTRAKIINESLNNQGAIIIVKDLFDAVKLANGIAPEHLEVMTERPGMLLDDIKNAGSVFLGDFSPEPLGDYYAGPNHVLPTSGTARFASPLSVDDFIKKMGVILYSKDELLNVAPLVMRFADAEGLMGHANAINVRFKKNYDI